MGVLELDRVLTLSINNWNSSFGDGFFFTFTSTWIWLPLALVLMAIVWRTYDWKTMLLVIAGIGLCILLADQTTSLIKHTVCRLRPTHEPLLDGQVHIVNGYVGGMFGFCSAHASNTASIVVFTALLFRNWIYSVLMSTWALLNMWSRIYLGVHYLGDILCGALLGMLIGWLIYILFCWIWSKTILSNRQVMPLCITYLIIVFAIIAMALANM
ncbi:MAG: phosphatase PAP2 family protein [Paludibacteraceae bacterium]|nr:phosphatase PAP2 family protein [Paludibacteraceae bacterium]